MFPQKISRTRARALLELCQPALMTLWLNIETNTERTIIEYLLQALECISRKQPYTLPKDTPGLENLPDDMKENEIVYQMVIEIQKRNLGTDLEKTLKKQFDQFIQEMNRFDLGKGNYVTRIEENKEGYHILGRSHDNKRREIIVKKDGTVVDLQGRSANKQMEEQQQEIFKFFNVPHPFISAPELEKLGSSPPASVPDTLPSIQSGTPEVKAVSQTDNIPAELSEKSLKDTSISTSNQYRGQIGEMKILEKISAKQLNDINQQIADLRKERTNWLLPKYYVDRKDIKLKVLNNILYALANSDKNQTVLEVINKVENALNPSEKSELYAGVFGSRTREIINDIKAHNKENVGAHPQFNQP